MALDDIEDMLKPRLKKMAGLGLRGEGGAAVVAVGAALAQVGHRVERVVELLAGICRPGGEPTDDDLPPGLVVVDEIVVGSVLVCVENVFRAQLPGGLHAFKAATTILPMVVQALEERSRYSPATRIAGSSALRALLPFLGGHLAHRDVVAIVVAPLLAEFEADPQDPEVQLEYLRALSLMASLYPSSLAPAMDKLLVLTASVLDADVAGPLVDRSLTLQEALVDERGAAPFSAGAGGSAATFRSLTSAYATASAAASASAAAGNDDGDGANSTDSDESELGPVGDRGDSQMRTQAIVFTCEIWRALAEAHGASRAKAARAPLQASQPGLFHASLASSGSSLPSPQSSFNRIALKPALSVEVGTPRPAGLTVSGLTVGPTPVTPSATRASGSHAQGPTPLATPSSFGGIGGTPPAAAGAAAASVAASAIADAAPASAWVDNVQWGPVLRPQAGASSGSVNNSLQSSLQSSSQRAKGPSLHSSSSSGTGGISGSGSSNLKELLRESGEPTLAALAAKFVAANPHLGSPRGADDSTGAGSAFGAFGGLSLHGSTVKPRSANSLGNHTTNTNANANTGSANNPQGGSSGGGVASGEAGVGFLPDHLHSLLEFLYPLFGQVAELVKLTDAEARPVRSHPVHVAAGRCLRACAAVLGADIYLSFAAFFAVHCAQASWVWRESALFHLGVLVGAASESATTNDDPWHALPLKEWGEVVQAAALGDPALAVRDTAVWVMQRLCQSKPRGTVGTLLPCIPSVLAKDGGVLEIVESVHGIVVLAVTSCRRIIDDDVVETLTTSLLEAAGLDALPVACRGLMYEMVSSAVHGASLTTPSMALSRARHLSSLISRLAAEQDPDLVGVVAGLVAELARALGGADAALLAQERVQAALHGAVLSVVAQLLRHHQGRQQQQQQQQQHLGQDAAAGPGRETNPVAGAQALAPCFNLVLALGRLAEALREGMAPHVRAAVLALGGVLAAGQDGDPLLLDLSLECLAGLVRDCPATVDADELCTVLAGVLRMGGRVAFSDDRAGVTGSSAQAESPAAWSAVQGALLKALSSISAAFLALEPLREHAQPPPSSSLGLLVFQLGSLGDLRVTVSGKPLDVDLGPIRAAQLDALAAVALGMGRPAVRPWVGIIAFSAARAVWQFLLGDVKWLAFPGNPELADLAWRLVGPSRPPAPALPELLLSPVAAAVTTVLQVAASPASCASFIYIMAPALLRCLQAQDQGLVAAENACYALTEVAYSARSSLQALTAASETFAVSAPALASLLASPERSVAARAALCVAEFAHAILGATAVSEAPPSVKAGALSVLSTLAPAVAASLPVLTAAAAAATATTGMASLPLALADNERVVTALQAVILGLAGQGKSPQALEVATALLQRLPALADLVAAADNIGEGSPHRLVSDTLLTIGEVAGGSFHALLATLPVAGIAKLNQVGAPPTTPKK